MGRPTSHDRDVRGPGNSVFRREVAGTGSVGESGRFSGPRRSGGGGGRSPLSFLVVIIIAVISLEYDTGNVYRRFIFIRKRKFITNQFTVNRFNIW